MMKHLVNLGMSFLLVFLVISMSSAIVSPASNTIEKTPANIPIVKVQHPLDNYQSLDKKDFESYLGRKMTFAEKIVFRLNKKKYVDYIKAEENASTNAWAIAGFVTSFFIGPLGIIFSAIALGKIKNSGEKGRGLAIAGLVIGIVSTVLIFLV